MQVVHKRSDFEQLVSEVIFVIISQVNIALYFFKSVSNDSFCNIISETSHCCFPMHPTWGFKNLEINAETNPLFYLSSSNIQWLIDVFLCWIQVTLIHYQLQNFIIEEWSEVFNWLSLWNPYGWSNKLDCCYSIFFILQNIPIHLNSIKSFKICGQ